MRRRSIRRFISASYPFTCDNPIPAVGAANTLMIPVLIVRPCMRPRTLPP
jgi:hypothetical protein